MCTLPSRKKVDDLAMWMLLTIVFCVLGFAELFLRRQQMRLWHQLVVTFALLLVAGAGFSTLPPGLGLGKVLAQLAMPLGVLWAFLLMMFLYFVHRRRLRMAALWLFAFGGLTIAGSPVLGGEWVASLEDAHWDDPFMEAPMDLVIVLGGGTTRMAPWRKYYIGPAGDRLFLGLRLYRAGIALRLGTSGSPLFGPGTGHPTNLATAALWQEFDVPERDIDILEDARNTQEEAKLWAQWIRDRGYQRIGLITSAWHLPRAQARFSAEGIAVIPLAADYRGIRGWAGFHGLIPSRLGAQLMERAWWETLGRWVGR